MSDQKRHTKSLSEPLFYDNADMKRLFNFSDKTLQRMRSNKSIPFVRIGKKYFYHEQYFKYLAAQSSQDLSLIYIISFSISAKKHFCFNISITYLQELVIHSLLSFPVNFSTLNHSTDS